MKQIFDYALECTAVYMMITEAHLVIVRCMFGGDDLHDLKVLTSTLSKNVDSARFMPEKQQL